MRRLILIASAALVLVAMLCVAAAGTQDQPTAGAQQLQQLLQIQQQPRPTRMVSIQGFAFVPAQITVRAGTKVTWVNNDSAPHTVTANKGAFDSGTLR